jgi:acetoin utilization deacetylase AcuC-like enzyme
MVESERLPDPRLSVVEDPRFEEHRAAQLHPERPERLAAIREAIAPLRGECAEIEPRAATEEEILRVHGEQHWRFLESLRGKHAQLDPDTYASPRSVEIARLAAGSVVELAKRAANGGEPCGFALVRPPGHHAERERAMGFCLLNSVAIAAAGLRAEAGVDRIAIVDWDVHHGNGTQHLFESDPSVLFVSLHQFPLYPGTGALREIGTGPGEGKTVNLPLPPGCGDGEYGAAFDEVVVPVLREFRPDLLLVSAGFDAHARDPLASMEVSASGFAAMAARVRSVAEEMCGGRVVLALEGGYDLEALGESVREVARVLAAREPPESRFPLCRAPFRTTLERIREAHSRYWRSLR